MRVVEFTRGKKGDPVALLPDGSLGLVRRGDPRASEVRPRQRWVVEVAGRSKAGNLAFLSLVATESEWQAEEKRRMARLVAQAVQEWVEGDEERKRFLRANPDLASGESWGCGPEEVAEALNRLFLAWQAETAAATAGKADMARLLAMLDAGPESPAPARPEAVEEPAGEVSVFFGTSGRGGLEVIFLPLSGRFILRRTERGERERFSLGTTTTVVLGDFGSLKEAEAALLSAEPSLASLWEAERSQVEEATRKATEQSAAYAAYRAAVDGWRATYEGWLGRSPRNRLYHLVQTGAVVERPFGTEGRWLFRVSEEGEVPLRAEEEL